MYWKEVCLVLLLIRAILRFVVNLRVFYTLYKYAEEIQPVC